MPKIYLSPSTQEYNQYVTGSGSEEQNMNLLADELEPYLYANAISFVRNAPEMTAASSISQANELGGFDFYLALHSNASGAGNEGRLRGIVAFYYPTSEQGKYAAELFAAQLRDIYPLPDLVTVQPTTALGEVRRPQYPANLLEIGYHDNSEDAQWIKNSREHIAQALARALTEYFSVPFLYPLVPQTCLAVTAGSVLRLRDYPGIDGAVIGSIPNGASVTVYGAYQGWYSVGYQGKLGYAAQSYIQC